MNGPASAAVLGATGPTGRAIARELLQRGVPTRVVSRSAAHLARDYADTAAQRVVADVLEPGACRTAIEGCEVAFDCVGFPLGQFDKHVTSAKALVLAMGETGARCVLVTGYWSSAPADGPISQSSPGKPTNAKNRVRIEQERILRGTGAAAVVLPDFYGPNVGVSVLNDAIKAMLAGSVVIWPGDPTALRDFVYIPDIARPVVEIALKPEALGRRWVIAGSGARAPAELLKQAAASVNKPLRLKRITPIMCRLSAILRRDMRHFAPVHPIYNAPATFDDSETRALVGDWPVTQYDRSIAATIDWLRSARQ